MKLLSLDTQGTKQDLVERVHAYLSTEQVSNAYLADLMLCWAVFLLSFMTLTY